MCATVVWAINDAAYTSRFERFTAEQTGILPQQSDFRIESSRVRRSAHHFTLTANGCDCDSLVGLHHRDLKAGEVRAERLLAWIHGLPRDVEHVSRLALLRTWSPDADAITPDHLKTVPLRDLSEARLRGIRDGEALIIDYTL